MSASAAAHARPGNEHLRSRASSPQHEEYATATGLSFDPARDAIHSTAQFDNLEAHQQVWRPQQHQLPDQDHTAQYEFDSGSEGSGSAMSIEVGRGTKRGARNQDLDISSNAIFNLANDSLYEVTGTPPLRSRNTPRKSTDGLRRQASMRRATELLKEKDITLPQVEDKHRSLSGHTHLPDTRNNPGLERQRETRTRSRFTHTALRQTAQPNVNNPTMESNQSFLLPENFPDLTELVAGARKDGPTLLGRTRKSRSRFTSASYKPAQPEYIPVDSVPVPEEEKAIYISIQMLKARNEELEAEAATAARRAEQFEDRILELQSELAASRKRASGRRQQDDDITGEIHRQRSKVTRSEVLTLQSQLERSERKAEKADLQSQRLGEERDVLVQQIGKVYLELEKVKSENDNLHQNQVEMEEINADLMEEIEALRAEFRILHQSKLEVDEGFGARDGKHGEQKPGLSKTMTTRRLPRSGRAASANIIQSGKNEIAAVEGNDTRRRYSTNPLDARSNKNLGTRSQSQLHRERENEMIERRVETAHQRDLSRSRSRPRQSQEESGAAPTQRDMRRPLSDCVQQGEQNAEWTDGLNNIVSKAKMSATHETQRVKNDRAREEDTRDLTLISILESQGMAKLRKQIEEDLRAGRLSGSRHTKQQDENTQQPTLGMTRKSSMKDVGTGLVDGTNHLNLHTGNGEDMSRTVKNVRLQSPSTDAMTQQATKQQIDGEDNTLLSNISRRRRRAVSAEGETSAFIIPDITMHNTRQTFSKTTVLHDPKDCTVCPDGKDAKIPPPVPVTDRPEYDPDVTNATVRPSQPPAVALATILKQLEDEIKHLKIKLAGFSRLYTQHDPAMSKSRRMDVKLQMDQLTAEIEKRSNQVYALYDVLEGQKAASAPKESRKANDNRGKTTMTEDEMNETLESIGIDAVELSGRVGRSAAPAGMDRQYDFDESDGELPWEGLSDIDGSEYN